MAGRVAIRARRAKLHRLADNPEEQRFALAWDAANRHGRVLAHLLSRGDSSHPPHPSDRDIQVAATVIQWLGSPVGQGFMRDLGYERKGSR